MNMVTLFAATADVHVLAPLERWVVFLNVFLALFAGLVNAYVVGKVGGWWRKVLVPVAILSFMYSASYLYLFITENVGLWSSTMRGVSILAWPIVWMGPAIMVLRVTHSMSKVIDHAKQNLPSMRYIDDDESESESEGEVAP